MCSSTDSFVHKIRHCYNSHPAKTVTKPQVSTLFSWFSLLLSAPSLANQPTSACDTVDSHSTIYGDTIVIFGTNVCVVLKRRKRKCTPLGGPEWALSTIHTRDFLLLTTPVPRLPEIYRKSMKHLTKAKLTLIINCFLELVSWIVGLECYKSL